MAVLRTRWLFDPTGSQTTEFSYDVEVLGFQSIIGNSLSYETNIPGISGITRVSETVRSLPSLSVIANTEVFTEKFDFNFRNNCRIQMLLTPI